MEVHLIADCEAAAEMRSYYGKPTALSLIHGLITLLSVTNGWELGVLVNSLLTVYQSYST